MFANPSPSLAHPGHGDEFHSSETAQSAGSVQLDQETVQRLDIQLGAVQRQPLVMGVKTTGEIEALPNQQVR